MAVFGQVRAIVGWGGCLPSIYSSGYVSMYSYSLVPGCRTWDSGCTWMCLVVVGTI